MAGSDDGIGRFGRWLERIGRPNGGRSLATSRSGIDVNLRVPYNGVSGLTQTNASSEEKKAGW